MGMDTKQECGEDAKFEFFLLLLPDTVGIEMMPYPIPEYWLPVRFNANF